MKQIAAALLVSLLACAAARADVHSLLQMVDYLGVDYAAAVHDGNVVNAAEYAEMQEFAGQIRDETAALAPGPAREEALAQAQQLQDAVASRADPDRIAAVTRTLRETVMGNFDVTLVPVRKPDLELAADLYARQCAGCHGATGAGDGPLGANLDPRPVAFTDTSRARQRSLFGLYNTITLGVPGTPMTAFAGLSGHERWSLAFYVGGLYGTADEAAAAGQWQAEAPALREAVTLSPAELGQRRSDGEAGALWISHHPDVLFAAQADPLQRTITTLAACLDAYRAGDRRTAQSLAVSAYLEGFELGEAALGNVDPKLMRRTEQALMEFRAAVHHGEPVAQIEQQHAEILALLQAGQTAMAAQPMSPAVAFTSSLIIMLREGLEAILVIAAMIAFLVRSERRDALVYVHGGWIIALLAGGLTWAASEYLIDISGSTRELTEGITTLVAAAILFYVGFWMHRNTSMVNWNQYLHGRMRTALGSRTLWTLATVSFLAVYREVFETVLFYQALWLQVEGNAHHAIIIGAVCAAAALVLVTWLFARFGLRLPMKKFFIASAVLLIVLAVIFAGKGVTILQEAGVLAAHPLPLPRIEIIGLYPNVYAVAVELLLIAVAVGLYFLERRREEEAD